MHRALQSLLVKTETKTSSPNLSLKLTQELLRHFASALGSYTGHSSSIIP